MSLIDPNETLENETENEEPTLPGAEATFDELQLLEMSDLIAWAEAHPEAWDALKRGKGTESPNVEPPAPKESDETPALEDLSAAQLTDIIDRALKRIDNPAEARELSILREDGGPDGSPSRLKALRDAAAYALQVAGPEPGRVFDANALNTVTYDPTHHERIEVDRFGVVRRTPLAEETTTDDADASPEFSGRESLEDLAGLSTEAFVRFKAEHPERVEALKRLSSDEMDKLQRAVRREQGIF